MPSQPGEIPRLIGEGAHQNRLGPLDPIVREHPQGPHSVLPESSRSRAVPTPERPRRLINDLNSPGHRTTSLPQLPHPTHAENLKTPIKPAPSGVPKKQTKIKFLSHRGGRSRPQLTPRARHSSLAATRP
ncbi:hypothetical protein ACTI_38080 [Actinoplanes sp. OR16]|nr:hypothetical protein ACTI_38080 [Actinoplanes sp. OR16]